MIGFVKGKVDYIGADYCLVDNNGIGYRIFMPVSNLASVVLKQEIKAYTYMAVREDAILLYGFLSMDYYNLFLQLISVSGVGAKSALSILSAAKPDEFYLAIQTRDMKFLTKLPGIGKKTAERMLLELKEKVGTLDGSDFSFEDSTGVVTGTSADDAIAALTALGYNNSEIIPVLKKIEDRDKLSSKEIIRQALKLMAGRN